MTQDDKRIGPWLRILVRKMEQDGNSLLKDTDITVMQLRVMKYLKAHPEAPQIADISEFFDVTHTSMIHVVNALEKKGYVYREPIRRSRGKKIILTDSGKKLADENEGRIDHLEEAMMDDFSASDQAALLKMLQKINNNLDKHFGK